MGWNVLAAEELVPHFHVNQREFFQVSLRLSLLVFGKVQGVACELRDEVLYCEIQVVVTGGVWRQHELNWLPMRRPLLASSRQVAVACFYCKLLYGRKCAVKGVSLL